MIEAFRSLTLLGSWVSRKRAPSRTPTSAGQASRRLISDAQARVAPAPRPRSLNRASRPSSIVLHSAPVPVRLREVLMRRREVIALLGSAAAWSFAAASLSSYGRPLPPDSSAYDFELHSLLRF